MHQILTGLIVGQIHLLANRRIHGPDSVLNICIADWSKGLRVVTIVVDQEHGVENLNRVMGVQGGTNPGNSMEISIDKFTQTTAVVNRRRTGSTRYEEFKIRMTEGVLDVDDHQTDSTHVRGSGMDLVFPAPRLGLPGPQLIGYSPHRIHLLEPKVGRHRKFLNRCFHSGSARAT